MTWWLLSYLSNPIFNSTKNDPMIIKLVQPKNPRRIYTRTNVLLIRIVSKWIVFPAKSKLHDRIPNVRTYTQGNKQLPHMSQNANFTNNFIYYVLTTDNTFTLDFISIRIAVNTKRGKFNDTGVLYSITKLTRKTNYLSSRWLKGTFCGFIFIKYDIRAFHKYTIFI